MKIFRFIVSTMLVSVTFGILGYVVIVFPLDSSDSIRMRGVSYLALVPYFLGALLNKEGYWQWSKDFAHPQGGKTPKIRIRVLQVIIAFLFVGLVSVAYMNFGSSVVRMLLLLILIAVGIWTVRRAWLVHTRKISGPISMGTLQDEKHPES